LKPAVLDLASGETWIGRETTNQICLSDMLASRRHCVIKREGDQLLLRDQDSSNGTFVNDVPVRERLLAEGDRIKIGDSHFLFLLREDETLSSPKASQFEDSRVVARSTLIIEPQESLYLRPEKMKETPLSARMAQGLSTLVKISTIINQIRNLGELRRRLLELIFDVIPAERGAIMLARERFEGADALFWLDRASGESKSFALSRTVVDRVTKEGIGLLSNDVTDHPSLRVSRSLTLHNIKALIAVPLTLYDLAFGAIYLDTGDPQVQFDEDHLQLLTAIAGIAAVAFDNVGQFEQLQKYSRQLQAELDQEREMIGESASMSAVYQTIAKAAPSDSTVLLRGESGTGKELAARAIHRLSSRADKTFMAINCAELSDTLLESELFGHEKGAFTGAVAQKKGKFEMASGGTVFLDEMGELPSHLQSKLLRALQEREIVRVGGTQPIKVDIRVIAATNRDLEKAIKDGGFRSDLYYRLNVVSIQLPPLRDRREDVPLLAHYFAMKYAQKCKRPVKGISPEARALLVHYDWPGNVRELENAIERAVVLGSTELLLPEDLPDALHDTAPPATVAETPFISVAREAKKQLVLQALEQADGNFTQAAKTLGIHPNNLHRLVRTLGLKPLLKKP
jgi:Nif-specific regulatory protein